MREIDAARDVPHQWVHALLKSSVWPSHPLGRPIAGRSETVRTLTREDAMHFFHKYYLPDRLIVAAAGNLEHEDFVAQVRDAFWHMRGRKGRLLRTQPVYQAGIALDHMPVSQTYFSLGIRALPYAHPQRYILHLLNDVLGGGISSRLFRRIRDDQGLVYDISSEYHAYGDDGLLVIEGSTAPQHLIQVLDLTLLELWKLFTGEEPVDEEEVWTAKMHIRGQHLISGENTHTRMCRLATQELYFGRHIPQEEILAQIEAVDAQVLQRFAFCVHMPPQDGGGGDRLEAHVGLWF